MVKFYCYKGCSTCKKTKKYLDNHDIKYDYIDIKTAEFSNEVIKNYHEKSKKEIRKLFNTSGKIYHDLNLKEKIKDMSEDECYELLSSDGFKESEYEELVK